MIVLDSSALIELINGSEKGKRVQDIINKEVVGITTLTVHEVGVGIPENKYTQFREFLSRFVILPFDEAASIESVRIEKHLTKSGGMIGRFDILIAAICFVQHSIIYSFDADFKKVHGLQVIL